jgi:ABC-type molybdate transport system ATPase subunit
MRLAFAIAALPRELGSAPGFLLLDDPLDAVDGERARTLIEVVTGSLLSEHFEQVIFVSHSSACDPARFAYHVAIEAGRVVESNLPLPPPVAADVLVSHEATEAVRGTMLSAVLHL